MVYHNEDESSKKTRQHEKEQVKRLQKSPDHGIKIDSGKHLADDAPKVKQHEEEQLQRREQAPQNKGRKVKLNPEKNNSNSPRIKQDEQELIERRLNRPQNKHPKKK